MQWEWNLIHQECTGCGVCADSCPHDAIRMSWEMAYPEPVPLQCVGCMVCIEQCPFDAIDLKRLNPTSAEGE
jgi:Pyruvate/2-oxoacid:ferredoxin oxidoreductase delta subunit